MRSSTPVKTRDQRHVSASSDWASVLVGGHARDYCEAVPADHLVHHVGVFASDFVASEGMYTAALAALGIAAGYRTESIAEYWRPHDDTPSLSLETAPDPGDVTRGLHLAFEAADRQEVDAFHRAAVAAGGRSRHEPRYWPEYRAYAAFVADPDGNNIEALLKES